MDLDTKVIESKKLELTNHPLLSKDIIKRKTDLCIFMEHHVFPVWDFMSLAKSLQNYICPSGDLWLPTIHTRDDSARLINEIVCGEESDEDIGGGAVSHFDLYLQSMDEIGANTKPINDFLDMVEKKGIEMALENCDYIPSPCIKFMRKTFDFISSKKKHVIASAFTYGREAVIPDMFEGILKQLNIGSYEAKKFHYYLERHIELDGDEHGPMAEKLVRNLCGSEKENFIEAEEAALDAINARLVFWSEVKEAIEH